MIDLGLLHLGLNLQELILVHVSLLLLILHFVVQSHEYLVEALKANWMFQLNLNILKISEVTDSQFHHDIFTDVRELTLGLPEEDGVLVHDTVRLLVFRHLQPLFFHLVKLDCELIVGLLDSFSWE